MSETTYYQRNWETILNSAKDYYKNDKGRLREYGRNRYHNISKEKKQRPKEDQKNYHERKKSKKKY